MADEDITAVTMPSSGDGEPGNGTPTETPEDVPTIPQDVQITVHVPDANASKIDPDQPAAGLDSPISSPTAKGDDTVTAAKPATSEKKVRQTVPFRSLFRFSDRFDTVLYAIGLIGAVANGVIFPLFTLLFGQLLDAFNSAENSGDALISEVSKYASYFVGVAIAAGLATGVEIALPMIAAERQMYVLHCRYFAALVRQDIGFGDAERLGEVVSRLAEDTVMYSGGIGEKLTGTVHHFITFITGLIIGFTKSWQLTLIIMAIVPFLVLVMGFLKKATESFERKVAEAYAAAGDIATEVFSTIRTISAFGGESSEVERYDRQLEAAARNGSRKGWFVGGAVGSLFALMFMAYGVGTWVGTRLIIDSRESDPICRISPLTSGCFTGGTIITTFMSVIIGAFALGMAGPNFGSFGSAQAAAYGIFRVIDRVPTIDVESKEGQRPPRQSLRGRIEFKNVTFAYPTRPNEVILKNFNLVIEPGTTFALVGESGSGKSTVLQLLQRFYDPQEGGILVDGIDVREWNLEYLRDQIGIVSQDPILFGTTIHKNIEFGKAGTHAATEEEVIAAATAANAHEFISTLKDGYHTQVGTSVSTTQLSGGQRQRVCIARAIIRDPVYLLLDEATSALDTNSERIVQAALDRIVTEGQQRRTVIVIAHRLSTITHADCIVVMERGCVVEAGTHQELMQTDGGKYRKLRELQKLDTEDCLSPTAAAVAAAGGVGAVHTGEQPVDVDAIEAVPAPAAKGIDDDELTEAPPVSGLRVWKLQAKEWPLIALGLLGAAASGVVQPVFAVIYSNMIAVFFDPNDGRMRDESNKYIGAFFAIAIAHLLATMCRIGAFVYLGEMLTRRLRTMVFRAVLRNEMAFFDAKKNSVGRLNMRLSTDAAEVRGGTGEALSMVFQAAAAIFAGIIIAFEASWRLGLVISAILPFMIVGALMQGRAFKGFHVGAVQALHESGHIATEAVSAIRTVAALNLQRHLLAEFRASLQAPLRAGYKKAFSAGAGQGFSQFMMFIGYSIAFYAGGHFMVNGWLDFSSLMRVFLALTMASQAAGNAINWGPDMSKADRATRAIFELIDRTSAIDPLADAGEKPAAPAQGLIEFRNVTFAYPSRPDRIVLQNFSCTIQPGQKVALVGPSGSGKSTIVQLLERFYDPLEGEILLDGRPLKDYNIGWLRQQYGLVQQEPSLMSDSIAYNIAYGRCGSKPVPDQGKLAATMPADADIVAAADAANATTFISGFQQGFGTDCGSKGSKLSGGQKQRIAIARAVVRDPRVLLCDEATSALDSHSEAVVQAALDTIMSSGQENQKRTSIVIAHRLATVKDADVIIVVEKGRIREAGNHEELMAQPDGLYRSLALAQDGTGPRSP